MFKQYVSSSVTYRWKTFPGAAWSTEQRIDNIDTVEMYSSEHPGWYRNDDGDSGGAFYLKKVSSKHVPGSSSTNVFDGGFFCGKPNALTLPSQYQTPSNLSLDAKGTTAIARTEPTRSVSDVATFIGELRTDGLPRLRPDVMRAQTKRARAAGSDYLNIEFGWRPFVTDLRKMARAVVDSHSILSNYRSHGKGQKIRRRYAFPTQSETTSVNATNFLPRPAAVSFNGRGVHSVHRQQDMWFSGAFRYYIPIDDTTFGKVRSHASAAQKLLGASITPETVWNVSPWSWLVDWQTNTGDVLHNISAMGRDGLVLQYGYMMAHTSYEESAAADFGSLAGWASYISTTDIKVRRPATPYGFGVDIAGLTPRQSAILVALGLSKT